MSSGQLETDLILQAVTGDQAALSELLLIHYDDLLQFVRRRIPATLQSLLREEDILHQTFVQVARGMGRYELRGEGSFGAWLRTIAANLIRDAERRRRRERRVSEMPGGAPLAAGSRAAAGPLDGVPGNGSTPSRRVQLRENLLRMQTALLRLPAEQREVLERRYLREESLEQIAAAMHRSKDAVRGICYRARQNLRGLMGRSSLYFSG